MIKTEVLNKLKEKVFSVLLKKLEIDEFESWLYNQKSIINSIEEEAFIYDLITINYKEENAISILQEVAFKKFLHEEYIILLIGINCKKMLALNQWDSIYKLFNEILSFFDYDKDYFLMWSFYSINSRIDLIDIGYETKTNITNEVKELSLQIVNQLKECNTASEKIKFLVEGFENDLPKKDVLVKESFIKEIIHKKWYEFWK